MVRNTSGARGTSATHGTRAGDPIHTHELMIENMHSFPSPGSTTSAVPPPKQLHLDQDDREEDDSDVDSSTHDSEYDDSSNNSSSPLPEVIDVRRSWGTMVARASPSDDVHAAVLEHRVLLMERRLSLPDEHPRSNSSESVLAHAGMTEECGAAARRRHGDSIEIRRTDAPQYAVRAEQRWTDSRPAYLEGRSRRLFSNEALTFAAIVTSRLR